jgi:hypothetical protein
MIISISIMFKVSNANTAKANSAHANTAHANSAHANSAHANSAKLKSVSNRFSVLSLNSTSDSDNSSESDSEFESDVYKASKLSVKPEVPTKLDVDIVPSLVSTQAQSRAPTLAKPVTTFSQTKTNIFLRQRQVSAQIPAPVLTPVKATSVAPKYVDLTISKKTRCFTCCLCEDGSAHGLRKCPEYLKYKNEINRFNYINTALNPKDVAGFCAGGIIPYCIDKSGEKYMLMLVENRYDEYDKDRKDALGLNFIAGGREGITDLTNKTVPETPYQTAINEFKEELEEILTPETFKLIKSEVENTEPSFVFWSGQSKMVLFGVKVCDLHDKLVLNNRSKKTTEAENFVWVKVSEYEKYIYEKGKTDLYFHKFTRQIVNPIVTRIRSEN